MKTIKTKIYLNNMAQKLLFGYFEGVDWQIGLTTQDADGTEREMTEKEQDLIHDKVLTWIDDYRKKYNGKFLVRGGKFLILEGKNEYERNVVIEFPSFEIAKEFYASKEYQEAKSFRDGKADFNGIVVEGFNTE